MELDTNYFRRSLATLEQARIQRRFSPCRFI
jgi:hypothetical protein